MKLKLFTVLFLLTTSTLLFSQSKYSIGINGGAAVPAGTMSDLYQSGFGGGLSFNYNLNPDVQLFLSVDYSTFKFNNDVFNDFYDLLGVKERPEIDATLNVIPVTVGARYFFSKSGFNPYGYAKVGLHSLSFKAVSLKVGNYESKFVSEESVLKYGWGLGVGFQAAVSKGINIDVNIGANGNGADFVKNFNYETSTTTYKEENKSSGLFFTFMAGLNFEF